MKPMPKIAVIELSTKSVKLLTGDQKQILAHGFKFDYFERETRLVHAGKLLDTQNVMNIQGFRKNVLPAIQEMYDICCERSVEEVYTVATAAYRSAKNRDEILRIIEKEVGLDVKILSKDQETSASVKAFFFSKPQNIELMTEIFCFIDQGGASTEISFLRKNGDEIISSYGLDLGTTVLHNVFFANCTKDTPFEKAFGITDQKTKERLRYYFEQHAPKYRWTQVLVV